MDTKSFGCGKLVLVGVGAAAAGVLVGRYLLPVSCKRLNHTIDLENNKVVHAFDIEDLGKKNSYCRCWKSKKFPMCDGTHNAHNKETGDNVGPVVVRKEEK